MECFPATISGKTNAVAISLKFLAWLLFLFPVYTLLHFLLYPPRRVIQNSDSQAGCISEGFLEPKNQEAIDTQTGDVVTHWLNATMAA